MTPSRRHALAAASLAATLTACGPGGSEGPWLTMPDADTHFARFPMGVDSSHAVCTDCNDCHREQVTAGAAWTPSASFKTFTCVGCHYTSPGLPHGDRALVDARHAAVAGYQYADADCLRCHPQGIAVDHAARFPLPHRNAAGTIAAVCSSCHVDPVNRKTMGCAACHPHSAAATATAHAKVPDFLAADSALCLRCHADGTVDRVSTHAGFPIAAGAHSAATVRDGISGGACLRCHPSNRTTAPKTYAADFKKYVCLGCHVQVRPGVWHDSAANLATLHDAGTSITDATCYGCHRDGTGGAPANHPQLFPIGAGTKHATVTCGQCHTNGTDLAARRNLANLACAACHAKTMGASLEFVAAHAIPGYAVAVTKSSENATPVAVPMTSPNCLKCHADSQVDRVAAHDAGEDGFGTREHRANGCLTCHTGLRADKPYPATNWNTEGGCGRCH